MVTLFRVVTIKLFIKRIFQKNSWFSGLSREPVTLLRHSYNLLKVCMRTFIFLFFSMCLTLFIISCSEEEENPDKEITGKWKMTERKFQDGTSVNLEDDDSSQVFYIFSENGSFELSSEIPTIIAWPYGKYEIDKYYVQLSIYDTPSGEKTEEIIYSHKFKDNILELTFFMRTPAYTNESKKIAKDILIRIE